jgi:hypothetical protein
MTTSSRLLDLPRELRDIIVNKIIHLPVTPTPKLYVPGISFDKTEFGAVPPSRPASILLASTCAQLRAATLQRVSEASIPAIFDIFILPDSTTQCTWLSYPKSRSHLELHINICVQPIDVKLVLDTKDCRDAYAEFCIPRRRDATGGSWKRCCTEDRSPSYLSGFVMPLSALCTTTISTHPEKSRSFGIQGKGLDLREELLL